MKKIILLSFCSLLTLSSNIAQSWLDKAQKKADEAKVFVDKTRKVVKSVSALRKELDQSTEQFNKNGRVEKGNDTKAKNNKTAFAKIKGGKFKDVAWIPVIYEENTVFPSAIVTLSTFNKEFTNELEVLARPIGFVINSNVSNQIIRWEIESSDKRFFDKVSGEFIIDESGKSIHIMPEIPWNYLQLTSNVTNIPATVTYRFVDDKENKIEETVRITYRSINDCILWYKDTRTHYMFAGYVQESHPEIDVILKESLQTGFVNSFSGYQAGNMDALIDQILAIWRALQLRGIKYSSITTSSAADTENISTQSVRTFDNSIQNIQANCVDGTVVFASILRKIGIHTQIITVKRHCYLGVYSQDKEVPRLFLETTALGIFPELGGNKTPDAKSYREAFINLLKYTQKKHFDYVEKGELREEIDVEEARTFINAIPVY